MCIASPFRATFLLLLPLRQLRAHLSHRPARPCPRSAVRPGPRDQATQPAQAQPQRERGGSVFLFIAFSRVSFRLSDPPLEVEGWQRRE